ncbi:MAG: hypothetical protein HZC26_02730 [Candidatus Magasanikbacteria bacterium]|nr:hypothetical protein [Candidatus Magasanikbacteria bacterium]
MEAETLISRILDKTHGRGATQIELDGPVILNVQLTGEDLEYIREIFKAGGHIDVERLAMVLNSYKSLNGNGVSVGYETDESADLLPAVASANGGQIKIKIDESNGEN